MPRPDQPSSSTGDPSLIEHGSTSPLFATLEVKPGMEYRSAVRKITDIINADPTKLKISLAGGLPPRNLGARVARQLLGLQMEQENFEALATYGSAAGEPKFRRTMANTLLAERGFEDLSGDDNKAWEHQVLADGGGSTHAIETVVAKYLDQGDFAFVSGPSFTGTIATLWERKPTFVQLSMDENGTKPEALRAALEMATTKAQATRAKGETPKKVLWYDMFNGHNPTGATVPLERRLEYLAILDEYAQDEKLGDLLTVVEDDAYYECFFGDENIPALAALARKNYPHAAKRIVYIASFSKSLNPQERLAMMVAPEGMYDKLLGREESSMLNASQLKQAAVADYVTGQMYSHHILYDVRPQYKAGRDTMVAALAKYQDQTGWQFNVPQHGMFIALKLPLGIKAEEFATKLYNDTGIAVLANDDFYVIHGQDADDGQTLRLCFATEPPAKIAAAIDEIAAYYLNLQAA